MFSLRTIGTGHYSFSFYRLFIAKDKLILILVTKDMYFYLLMNKDFIYLFIYLFINLTLIVFFILPRGRAIFQKFEGNSSENNWNCRIWLIAKSLTIFLALSCRQPKKMSRKIP